jgi:hypothetical protein
MTYEYLLSWPPGFPRTEYSAQSRFDTPEERVKRNLKAQLDMMNATNVVVTTNSELRRDGRPYVNQRISDTGVAVYFTRKGREQAIACDKWDSIRDNLQAVAKTTRSAAGNRTLGDRRDGRCHLPGIHGGGRISQCRHSGSTEASVA